MSDDVPVKIDIGLSAKAEVKAEVPASSMGRLVDALTDAIRPFTELRGLKADMIRLQREEVLIEIAKRAKNRAEIECTEILPVPSRILVPLLEKASLTDIDEEVLVDAWSNLLTSAASGKHVNLNITTDILSTLSREHLEYLEFLFDLQGSAKFKDTYLERDNNWIRSQFRKLCSTVRAEGALDDEARFFEMEQEFVEKIECPGLKVISGAIEEQFIQGSTNGRFSEEIYAPLAGRGLIEFIRIDLDNGSADESDWLYCARATLFGGDFISICKTGRSMYFLRPNDLGAVDGA